jgi:nickel-dependent lactate racemase
MLLYGSSSLPLPSIAEHAPMLEGKEPPPMPNPWRAWEMALERPLGRPPLSEWVRPGQRVAVVVPDRTRHLNQELLGHIVSVLQRVGAQVFVRIANGTHRRMSQSELSEHVSALANVPVGDRDCDDVDAHALLGTTPSGIEARIDREVARADRIVMLGPVSFHYLAGFGGGAKLLAPGLADRATAKAIHRRCLDPVMGRHERARSGVFPHENPMHQAIAEVVKLAPPIFSVVTLENSQQQLCGLFCGEPSMAHHHACTALEGHYQVSSPRLRCAIVSPGGAPYGQDFIQAHKSLEAVAAVMDAGGAIIWVASCNEGVPARARRWLELGSASAIEAALRADFDITGYTLFAARSKAERFRIFALTEMDDETCRMLGFQRVHALDEVLRKEWVPGRSAVVPHGARFLLTLA